MGMNDVKFSLRTVLVAVVVMAIIAHGAALEIRLRHQRLQYESLREYTLWLNDKLAEENSRTYWDLRELKENNNSQEHVLDAARLDIDSHEERMIRLEADNPQH